MSQIIGVMPFFINYRKHLNNFLELRKGLNTDKVLIKAEELKEVYKELKEIITNLNKKVRK